MKMEVFARRADFRREVQILLSQDSFDGTRRYVGQPVVFKEHDLIDRVDEPTMALDERSAQLLMDELWNCGLRPTEGTGSAGSLAATQSHLKDMQRLTFAVMGIDKP